MKTWLLSVIGVVLLIAVAEMILPEGRLRKNIRAIFALIMMLTILKPLPNIRNETPDWDFDLDLDYEMLAEINARKVRAMETDGAAYLKERGYGDCRISLVGEWTDSEFSISTVMVFTASQDETIAELAADYYGAERSKVVVSYE